MICRTFPHAGKKPTLQVTARLEGVILHRREGNDTNISMYCASPAMKKAVDEKTQKEARTSRLYYIYCKTLNVSGPFFYSPERTKNKKKMTSTTYCIV